MTNLEKVTKLEKAAVVLLGICAGFFFMNMSHTPVVDVQVFPAAR